MRKKSRHHRYTANGTGDVVAVASGIALVGLMGAAIYQGYKMGQFSAKLRSAFSFGSDGIVPAITERIYQRGGGFDERVPAVPSSIYTASPMSADVPAQMLSVYTQGDVGPHPIHATAVPEFASRTYHR